MRPTWPWKCSTVACLGKRYTELQLHSGYSYIEFERHHIEHDSGDGSCDMGWENEVQNGGIEGGRGEEIGRVGELPEGGRR